MYEIDDIAPLTLRWHCMRLLRKRQQLELIHAVGRETPSKKDKVFQVKTSCTVGKVDNTAALSHIA